jgi:hypothetical protein
MFTGTQGLCFAMPFQQATSPIVEEVFDYLIPEMPITCPTPPTSFETAVTLMLVGQQTSQHIHAVVFESSKRPCAVHIDNKGIQFAGHHFSVLLERRNSNNCSILHLCK